MSVAQLGDCTYAFEEPQTRKLKVPFFTPGSNMYELQYW